MSEYSLHFGLAQYLKMQYPNVIFRSDYAAGMSKGKAHNGMHKALQSGRAYPDLFIAEPRPKEGAMLLVDTSAFPDDISLEDFLRNYSTKTMMVVHQEDQSPIQLIQYHGLYIELKREGTVLVRPKDARAILKGETKLRLKGDWFDEHIEEQARMLARLRKLGYRAEFAIGFDNAKKMIDEYLR